MRTLKTIAVILLVAVLTNAQDQQVVYTSGIPRTISLLPGSTITNGSGAPSGACVSGSTYTDSTNTGIYNCLASVWVPVIAPGSVTFQISGTCVAGWTQLSQSGNYILLTLAANSDVGTTGGSNAFTPVGTVAAPTFTGSSATSSAVSAGTPAGTNGTVAFTPVGTNGTVTGPAQVFTGSSATTSATSAGTPAGTVSALTTGADSSTTGGVAKAIAQTPTFTGSALATHTHTLTATGTNGTSTIPAETFTGTAGTIPAETFTGSALATHTHTLTATGTNNAPAFTGTGATIQPTFLKLIGCSKN